ncbi:MAG TPA: ATP-binding protein [Roseiflexaceae bacterium]|nr:ATP-binding protein [Roseiflexaceae bacterium]
MKLSTDKLRNEGYLTWPSFLAWITFALILFQTWILPHNVGMLQEHVVRSVYVLAGFVGAILILVAASKLSGKRRWSALIMFLGIFASSATNAYQFVAYIIDIPRSNPITETVYFVSYTLAIVGVGLYFDWRSSWLGSVMGVIFDGAIVGFSVYVILVDILPKSNLSWAPSLNGYIAVDLGILFSVLVVALRYGRSGGPVVILSMLAVMSLLIGDLVFTYFYYFSGLKSSFQAAPLYSLTGVLIGLAQYRGACIPPKTQYSELKNESGFEWILWSFIPRIMIFAAFASLVLGESSGKIEKIIILLIFVAIHETIALRDYSRMFHDLRLSQVAIKHANAHQARLLEQRQIAAAEVAHDMGNALLSVRLALSRLRDLLPPPVARAHHLDAAEAGMEFTDDLLTALVAAAQIDAGALQLALQPTVLDALVTRVVRQQTPRALALRVQVQIHLPPDLPPVSCDPRLLGRAIANVLSNAIKYTGAARASEGLVMLSAEAADGRVQLAVIDNGPGIAPADLERVRERFQRGGGSGAPAGFGLGLAFAHGVVACHPGGDLQITSVPNEGTCVIITLAEASDTPEAQP